MIKCKNCNTVTSSNKTYCSNACKQKAYRMRRNVMPKPIPPVIDENAPTEFEYAIVIGIIEQEHYLYSKPTYLEYAFVRHYHPHINKIRPFVVQLILIKKQLDTGYLESPYKSAFKSYLEKRLNR